jgi:hypothetical protein
LLQIGETCKAETINTAEHLNTEYKEDQCVNTVQNYESNETNVNSTINRPATIAEELNHSNKNSDTKRKAYNKKRKIKSAIKEKMSNQLCIYSKLEV